MPTLAPTATLPATSTPAFAPTSTATLLPPTPTAPAQQITLLAENVSGLDDLALAPDGSIYVSNVDDSTLKSYAPQRAPQTIVSGLKEPEGIVVLPDGVLIIVEQGSNRLLRYDPATQQLTTWLQLENTTGLLGVDNIALDDHDPQHLSLIVPDSPNGRVLRVPLDGTQVSEIARGFLRPTGAAIEPDGSILIVDENGSTLKRIHPDGTIEFIASLPVPDDVVVDAQGTIYVATLGDSAIYQFAPGWSQGKVFVTGLAGPQGLALDRAGNLIVADTGHRRLISIRP